MRRLITIIVFIGLMAASALAAPTLQIGYPGSSYGKFQTGSGGEFTVNPSNPPDWTWDPLQYYADGKELKDVGVDGTFQTFCLEHSETINGYASTYEVVFSDEAVYGGVASADPLSRGSAWLYKQFQDGILEDYDYIYTDIADRKADADALQKAIWWLEDETGGVQNAYANLAINHFGTAALAKADNNGIGVKVMQLWDIGYVGVDGHQHQDLLVCIPAPGAILLGSIGIGLVGWLRRRRTL